MVHEKGDYCCIFTEASRHKDVEMVYAKLYAVLIFIKVEGYWLCSGRCKTKESYTRNIRVSELM